VNSRFDASHARKSKPEGAVFRFIREVTKNTDDFTAIEYRLVAAFTLIVGSQLAGKLLFGL
jgi:hypothetical protein